MKLTADKLKRSKSHEEQILKHVRDEHVRLAVQSQLRILYYILDQVDMLEKEILAKIEDDNIFKLLQTIPGVGPILAMTIMLETGEIKRFASVG